MKTSREKFEAFITAPPLELSPLRFSDNAEPAWEHPGQYFHDIVQVAWEAWQEAERQATNEK